MRAARAKDVTDAEMTEYRIHVFRHLVISLMAVSFVFAALATTGWYAYEASPPRQTVDGAILYRHQVWDMAYNGIAIKIRWCTSKDPEGPCTDNIDEYRYFDDAANHESLKWADCPRGKGKYPALAAEAAGAGSIMMMVGVLLLGFQGICMLVGVVAYVKQPHRNVMLPFACAHVVATVSACFLNTNFATKTQPIRDLMLKSSFIDDTTPLMESGYSNILYIIGIVLMVVNFYPWYYMVTMVHTTLYTAL